MSNQQKILASQVVEKFKSLLNVEIKNSIGEHNFEALNSLVRDAITDHSEANLNRLEDMIKQMRAELDKRPLEL